ncbi:MAG: HNH/ENDO VII family nuclease [Ruminococcus sp.]|nr:HNH/ENDO VII family nuclease [Ruminococcus sp.]
MKKIILILLSVVLVLSSCSQASKEAVDSENSGDTVETTNNLTTQTEISTEEEEISFTGLDDDDLAKYIEETVYNSAIEALDSDEYFVESVSTVYISQEYIDEKEYNSKENIFFGYTLSQLDEIFNGEKYVFTLDENNQTTVKEFEAYDDTYDKVIKNVAIGTGVILICVTVSAVTSTAAPAVSMIFAVGAKSGTIAGLSSGAIGGLVAGVTTGIETRDFDEAIKAAALEGSESFKWGAIIGSATGAASETIALKNATLNGLTMNEAASIQKETKWSLEAITSLHSWDEYEIYRSANVSQISLESGESILLSSDIDWDLIDENGLTNLQRAAKGNAPLDSSGNSIELHHVGQKTDSPLVTLTKEQHRSSGNNTILHYAEEGKDITSNEWNKQRNDIWKSIADYLSAN